jgi:hypothetical protein
MAEPVQTSNSPDENVGKGPPNAEARVWEPKAVDDYVRRLSEEHKMLVALKAQLYGGSWEPMLDDLRNRLVGKPYIFKLVHRIQDDISASKRCEVRAEHLVDS